MSAPSIAQLPQLHSQLHPESRQCKPCQSELCQSELCQSELCQSELRQPKRSVQPVRSPAWRVGWLRPWLLLIGLVLMPLKATAQVPDPDSASLASSTAPAPTANFVPQVTLDAARRLAALSTPGLPGLGWPDKFLPSADRLTQVRLVIKLSDRRVYVYSRDQLKTSFPVAIGRAGWETPVGTYQVIDMQHDPIWQHPFTGELVPPGSDNPLGVRWIGFWTDGTNYIGLHGTPNEESVGRPASHGCVRMYNQDVVKLFEMVRLGTPVEVIP
jgi:L,D-transpeptidase ErfK/SrfK